MRRADPDPLPPGTAESPPETTDRSDRSDPPATAPVWADSVWDDRSWRGLAALEGELDAEVCVVGLGGSGLACVRELQAHGAEVVGLDAGEVAGGAAGANGGFLLAGLAAFYHRAQARHGRERTRAIYRLTLEQLDRMQRETPELVRRVGSLRVAVDEREEDDCRLHLEALRRDGFAAEPYVGPEGRGILLPSDGAFDPLARCRTLAARALADGARLFERSPAVALDDDGVRTPHGRVRCRRWIVAVDGRLEALLPQLAGEVRTARLQMLATEPTDEVLLPRPVYARYGLEYWQQTPDGRLALGGRRDLGGDAEWTHASHPSRPVQEALERDLRERLGVRAAVTHRWAASVGYSRTGLPLVRRLTDRSWAIGGYSGTGNVLGALCGRGVAQLALTGRSAELAPLLTGSH